MKRKTLLAITLILSIANCNPFTSKGQGDTSRIFTFAANESSTTSQTTFSIQGVLKDSSGSTINEASMNVSSSSISTALAIKDTRIDLGGETIVSEKTPEKLEFTDIDPSTGTLAGSIVIYKAQNETDITHYNLYWGKNNGEKIKRIGRFASTGQNFTYFLPLSTEPATDASYLLAYPENSTGELATFSKKEIKDTSARFFTDASGTYTMALSPGTFSVKILSKDGIELGEISLTIPETIEPGQSPPTPTSLSGDLAVVITGFGEVGADITPIDTPVPVNSPGTLTFTDTDSTANQIGGTLTIGKAADESDITSYAVYFGSSTTTKVGNALLDIAKTGSDLSYTIPTGTLTSGATHILVYSKNINGENTTPSAVAINDLSQIVAAGLSFTDTDTASGTIGGNIQITPATDESSVTSYVLYWSSDGSTKSTYITELTKTGSPLTYTISNGTAPLGNYFLVIVKTADGEATIGTSVAIVDVIPAPSGLNYPLTEYALKSGVSTCTITPSVTGTISSYSISPSLPTGLTFDTSSGSITGTPSGTSSATSYTVTASNSGGNTATAITLSVGQVYYFTNAGSTGRSGPAQSDVDSSYSCYNLSGLVTVVAGLQEWTVPTTGSYQIEATGAQGGSNSSKTGGNGARMIGTFTLTAGDVIRVLVGQTGLIDTSGGNRGGGGGSFVWKKSDNTLYIAAGGGGGAGGSVSSGTAGVTTETGSLRADGLGTPGNSGNGGTNGAGWLSNGTINTSSDGSTTAALGILNGGTGGEGHSANTSTHYGGFGGGGGAGGSPSTTLSAGGGGGYSGGAGEDITGGIGGGGGGSYNAGSSQSNTAGANSGHGYVKITAL
ncbi:MAG: putative Ig domain-containing protein [Spirochaetota bacterium]